MTKRPVYKALHPRKSLFIFDLAFKLLNLNAESELCRKFLRLISVFVSRTPLCLTHKWIYFALFQQYKQEVAITCSTDYARHVKLLSPRGGFYKCECRSISPVFTPSQQSMQCFMHVWECPT